MDIKSTNINEYFDTIEKHINEADFISIKFEITGSVEKIDDESLDVSQKRYNFLKAKYAEHGLFQIGICPFKYENDRYFSTPYNLSSYQSQLYFDRSFYLQANLLESKRNENFDINAWIDESSTFIPKAEVEAHLKNIANDKERRKNIISPPFSIEEKEALSKIYKLIDEWLERTKNVEFTDHGDVEQAPYTHDIDNYHKSISNSLNAQTKFSFRELPIPDDLIKSSLTRVPVFHQEINIKYPNLITEYSQRDKRFVIKRIDEVEKMIRNQQEVNRIIDVLIQCKKPIVGYNVLIELMLLYQFFIDELPNLYKDFKERIHSMFPKVLDTRYIETKALTSKKFEFSSTERFDGLLQAILKASGNEKIDIELSEPFNRYQLQKYYSKIENSENDTIESSVSTRNPGYFNEAGFHAFIAGVCFCYFGKLMKKKNERSNIETLPHYGLLRYFNYVNHFDWEFRLFAANRNGSHYSKSTSKKKRKRKTIENSVASNEDHKNTPNKIQKLSDEEMQEVVLQHDGKISNRTRASITPASKRKASTSTTTTGSKRGKTQKNKKIVSVPIAPLDEEIIETKTPKRSTRSRVKPQTTGKKQSKKNSRVSFIDHKNADSAETSIVEEEIESIEEETLNEVDNETSSQLDEDISYYEHEELIEEEEIEQDAELETEILTDIEKVNRNTSSKLKDYPECSIS